MWAELDTTEWNCIDSCDINDLDAGTGVEVLTSSEVLTACDNLTGLPSAGPSTEWHSDNAVLNHALGILQSRCSPEGVPVFRSNPDYDTLLYYYHDNRDPYRSIYVVNASGAGFSAMIPAATGQRRTNHWGSSKSNQPRFHLVGERWVTNAKLPPSGTKASLLCRGGDYSKSQARQTFERILKPWRCVAACTIFARTPN